MARQRGTEGDDQLVGTDLRDILVGYGGNDTLSGLGGDDILRPGTGADTLLGGDGDDVAIFADIDSTQPDTFDGGAGTDTLDMGKVTVSNVFNLLQWSYNFSAGSYTVSVFGDPFNAVAPLTFSGVERIVGSRVRDQMFFFVSNDALVIDTGRGDDSVSTGNGDDVLRGGFGRDSLDGGGGRNRLFGDEGNDTLNMSAASSGLVDGGAGKDTLIASGDVDLLKGVGFGSTGDRIIVSGIENVTVNLVREGSVVRGDDRSNVLNGGGSIYGATYSGEGGVDRITGGDGADRLRGGDGNDILNGGFGADILAGDKGADLFVFSDDERGRAPPTDRISDFTAREGDRIDLTGIDANTNNEVFDSFRFIGKKAFSDRAGELRYEVRGETTTVEGDLDGDGRADFRISLSGKFDLTGRDFILTRLDAAPVEHSLAYDAGGHHGPTLAFVDPVLV